jgi:RNA polymerase sigma-70 factor (ECF subfamily)
LAQSAYSSSTTPLEIGVDARHGADPIQINIADDVLLLYDDCAPAVRRFVRSCGIPPDVADDIVQETFIALFQHLRKGGGRQNLRGWLMQVGYRQALKYRRREGRRWRWQRPWTEDVEDVRDGTEGPEESCVAKSDERRLRAVLRALPERDRQCVLLRADGLRYRDIATTLGISLGAVAKSLTRAVGRLSAARDR